MTQSDWLAALVAPSTIAIIGASSDESRIAARPLSYLRRHGFAGDVYPVNPNRSDVLGERAWPDLAAVPASVDHAYIVGRRDGVLAAVEDCARAGVPVATILADGFAEAGPMGRRRQAGLVKAAKIGGVRLLGPNSLGVINPRHRLVLSANAALQAESVPAGSITAISQSGSLIGTLLSRGAARGIGFAKLISVGNEADLTVGEIGLALVDDPETKAFVLFLDSLTDAPGLARFARGAHAAGKPIVAYLLGRSEAGRAAALSHTGALAGAAVAADAFLRAHGILRVDQLETLLELPNLLIGRAPPRRPRRSAAVVSTTGGGGAIVVDGLGAAGVEIHGLGGAPRRRLAHRGIAVKAGRLIDVTLAGTRPEVMDAVLGEALADRRVDLVVAVAGSSAQFQPELAVRPIVGQAGAMKPLVAAVLPEADASLRLLAGAGIAAFRTPEACADGVRAYLDWRPPRAFPRAAPVPAVEAFLGSLDGDRLDEAAALALFKTLGIETAPHVVLRGDTPEEPKVPFGFPVAAKLLSVDVAHKTEVGGVILDISDAADLKLAMGQIAAAARAAGNAAQAPGFLVQKMEAGVGEVLLGYRNDPAVGPTITVGAGGTLAEVYRDTVTELAPVTNRLARTMIEQVKGLAPIRGYRNQPSGDLDALAHAVIALSRLATVKTRVVAEAEINPLIVRPEGQGVVAVDGLVALAKA